MKIQQVKTCALVYQLQGHSLPFATYLKGSLKIDIRDVVLGVIVLALHP